MSDRVLVVITVIFSGIFGSWLVLVWQVASHDPDVVQCQEDELWYPADYDPPIEPDDLACIHIDTVVELYGGTP